MDRFHFVMPNLLYSALCLAAGALLLVKPAWMWKLEHLISARGETPPDTYRVTARVCGALMLAAAVVMLLIDFRR